MTVPSNDELLFLALGGAGEIGMNLNLYGHAGKWLMVDLGIGFADDSMPGVDVIMPDPAFIEERRDSLIGIVLTHAHEDHLGAVADLWPRLKAPVYATPFAASVLRRKLVEAGLVDTVPVTEIPLGGKFSLPPFELELITMTHSILEPNALAIRTKLGTVFHTGDWKIDPEPLLGEVTDEAMLRRIGDEGALAMVCDSTNVFVEGEAGSEATVRANLEKLVKVGKGRVAVTCFASNLARVESAALAAVAAGRHPVLSGRALLRMVEAAQECGYLLDFPQCIPEQQAGYLPRDKVLFICTGSQGEPRASMAKLANGEHRDLVLEAGDTAIFSSRVIPGNERSVGRLHNALAGARRRGDHRPRRRYPRLGPSGARRAGPRLSVGAAEDRPAGPWRGPPHDRACGPRARLPGAGDDRGAQRHPGPPRARAGRDHRSRAVPAGWRATATAWCRSTVRRCASGASFCGTARRRPAW